MNNKTVNILNTKFTTLFIDEVIDIILKLPTQTKPFFIITPNPEILLKSQKDAFYKEILSKSDLNLPDGNGLIWAHDFLINNKSTKSRLALYIKGFFSIVLFIFKPKDERKRFNKAIHGSDLTLKLAKKAALNNKSLFFLGNVAGIQNNSAEIAAQILKTEFPNLNIKGIDALPDDLEVIENIKDFNPDYLFIGFGAPTQEKWIFNNLDKLNDVKMVIGVGGTFDFLSGAIPRAPKIFRNLGFEWLYRLIKQPIKRLKRIINAVLIFPITLINWRIANPDIGSIDHK